VETLLHTLLFWFGVLAVKFPELTLLLEPHAAILSVTDTKKTSATAWLRFRLKEKNFMWTPKIDFLTTTGLLLLSV
jgi:hypothetical protein